MDANLPDISDLIGLPFELHGRFGKTKGIDCYGLVLEVEKRLGRNLPDVYYPNEYEWQFGLGILQRQMTMLNPQTDKLQLGDIGIWQMEDGACHAAVALGRNEMIHSACGKVRVTDIKWFKNKGMEFYRWD